jgi:rod shape determining protein RodA
MIHSEQIWRKFDYVLFGVTILLIVFGILMIRSSTQGAIDPTLITRVPDQIRFAILGLIFMVALSLMDYRILSGLQSWIYLVMVALLILVLFFGVEGDGGVTQGWINLGIRVQPAEIAKVLIIITLAHFLARRYHEMDRLSTIFKSLIHIGIPAGLIFIQPDLGMTIVFAVVWFVMVWAAGLRLRHIALFVLILTISAPVVWSQMEDYQRSRITTFISPQSDPDSYYNIRQALISVGSGGTVGKGYSVGSQNKGRFLRVRHTDFIFSVISEEFGFVGGMAVLVMIALVLMRILYGAQMAPDAFGSLICYGVAAFIFFQTVTSVGMNLGLIPVTGLTLPFISSGGTSLLSTLAGIGLAESVIARRRRI